MAARIFRRRSHLLILLSSAVFLIFITFNVFPYLFIDIGYLSRPLWDKPQWDFDQTIVHNYAEGMSMKERCEAHGWTLPAQDISTNQNKVYDAIIFSVELDMLEIRMRELWDVVDKFVILESNATFTGLPKERVFQMNRERFAFAESKIMYKFLPLYPLEKGESPWVNEGRTRNGMTTFLLEVGVQQGDLVTFSDVDEIISRHTIELLKACEGVPQSLHLQTRNYLYSYEFPLGDEGMWRTSIHKWVPDISYYTHQQTSKFLLTDAGWHCSFCFRTIKEFQFKMEAYSHSDRVRYSYLKEPTWIQQAICEGKDLFGMFPEAYSFKELFTRLGSIPKSTSAVGLPRYVLENRQRFKFLLPGGCQREGPLHT
ncbi:glycosyl transferase [Gamsiella multidivaricata]|uniref:glycosyl transferase n=1 Tax=Gamsiella multidivaricata TaxID=101098 RepID=UPI00221E79CD|nr:glycosyl transferase [Gamsiella multidivaricata]KAG0352320.1 hypothetical protein BGZ54_002853 [Gamsiella multidivaricata]KAI7828017.1 glycosyl transferase [Gamsiella multidivaricata]